MHNDHDGRKNLNLKLGKPTLKQKEEAPSNSMLLTPETAVALSVWCGGQVVEEVDPFDDELRFPAVNVPTRSGVERASLGDYVIKDEDGTFAVKGPLTDTSERK